MQQCDRHALCLARRMYWLGSSLPVWLGRLVGTVGCVVLFLLTLILFLLF